MWIKIDYEYNAEKFFDHLSLSMPGIHGALLRNDICEVTLEEWKQIKQIPGFDGGPEYAPFALIETKNE